MTIASLNIEEMAAVDPDYSDKYVGMKGSEIFHEMMREHEVEVIFGYPGGAILPVFDAIYQSPHFNFILTRHEQGAGHMADGYARATGKPGIVLVTSGPGATNTVTPLATAMMDSVPMIVFSGQVATAAIGNDAFQEADVTGIVRPCTKWCVLVKTIEELPRRINEAFHIATSGRPGPVLVDLPKDITSAVLKQSCIVKPHIPGYSVPEYGTSSEIAKAAEMINKAKRPLLYVGGGAITSGAHEEVRELAEKANIPVTTTLLGMGAFDEHDPKTLHMLGMHGSAYANYAMQEADLVISIGARFDDRVTGDVTKFVPAAREAERRGEGGIIHFDIDPANINKSVEVTLGVVGDAKKNLEKLLPLVTFEERKEWFDTVNAWKEKYPFSYDDSGEIIKPQAVIAELHKQTDGEAVITTGVGQHQMWAAQFYRWRFPRQMITSGGLGTMGYGVPSAIGAALGLKGKRQVIDIDGDGSFLMLAIEMITAAEYNIPAKIIVLNNDFQGMVKQWQDLFYNKRYSGTPMQNPDFAVLGEAMGVKGIMCERKEDIPNAIKELLEHDGPVVAEFKVDKEEHVYPMVPAGKALHEMELGGLA